MSSLKIVRKLEPEEVAKNRSLIAPNIFISVRFRSRVDLFARLDVVADGIRAWKSIHQILRANVVKQADDEFYFAVDENSSVNRNLENIQFLRLKFGGESKKPVDVDLISELISTKYAADRIDFEKTPDELLWRMALVEMREFDGLGVYELHWFFHHIIGDGFSAKESLFLLLDLILRKLKGDEPLGKQVEMGIYPGTRKMFEREIELIAAELSDHKPQERAPSRRPGFIDRDRAVREAFESLEDEIKSVIDRIDDFELLDLNHNQTTVYASRAQLIDALRSENHQKLRRVSISEQDFLRLKAKSKQEGVKISSLVNTIVWIALARLYKHRGVDLDEINSWTAVSLRRFQPENGEFNHYMLGYCVGSLIETFRVRDAFTDVLDDSEVCGEKFWSVARDNDRRLSDRVLNDPEKFAGSLRKPSPSPPPLKPDDLIVHTGLSNLGVIDSRLLVASGGVLEFESVFAKEFLSKLNIHFLFFNYLMTLNSQLVWTVTYNRYLVQQDLVDEYVSLLTRLITKLAN